MTEEIIIDGLIKSTWNLLEEIKKLQDENKDLREGIHRLEQLKNKYYQQTLDDEIQINNLLEEIQQIKQDRNVENITRLSLDNKRLEQENKELKEKVKSLESEIRQKKMTIMMNNDHYLTIDENNRKYSSALEEIREIITNDNSMIIDKKIYFELQCGEPVALKLQKIYNKINEVLK